MTGVVRRRLVSAQEARQGWAGVLTDAGAGVQSVVVRRSAPVAVVVPVEWFVAAAALMGEPWPELGVGGGR